jgi:predicted ATP-grasp superfamily ATP-dependent carboligase
VTYARSLFSLAVIRSLGARGVEVIVGDELELTPGGLSRYATATFTYPNIVDDPDGYLDTVEAVLREHAPSDGAPFVFLPMQKDTPLVARHRARFERLAGLVLAEADRIGQVDNKRHLVEAAQAAGVEVPRTWLIEDADDLESRISDIELPAFVKRPDGSGGAGIAKVTSEDELRTQYEEIAATTDGGDRAPFVQAFAPGTDYCFSALYDHGRRVATMSYECLATYPRNKGPGAVRRTVEAPELEAAGNRLLEHIDWHGLIELDFRWEGSGHTPYLIEANPRFFGGTFLGMQAGVDYPWLAFRLACGEAVEAQPPAPGGVTVRTPVLDVLATAAELVAADVTKSTLEAMLAHTKTALAGGGTAADLLRTLGADLRRGLRERAERLDHVQEIVEAHGSSVLEVLDKDDPGPVLGLLYPLAIFVEHGEITPELLVGAGSKG